MKEEEQEIIRQLKQGGEKAYHYLFDNHYVLLCKLASEFLKDDFLAETIVGNVIVHMWEKRETLDITISLRAYLVRAVRNSCINFLQQQYVQKEIRFSTAPEFNPDDFTSFIDPGYPLATLLEKELEQEITLAIERLPQECRQVFCLSRFENMKNKDIADKLNVSVNTVKYHMKNALAKLSVDLDKYLITHLLLLSFFS